MARLARFVIPDQPQHVIVRGNNREPIFYAGEDYTFWNQGVILNLPQFNGYFKLATMSPKEYPHGQQKKALQDVHPRV